MVKSHRANTTTSPVCEMFVHYFLCLINSVPHSLIVPTVFTRFYFSTKLIIFSLKKPDIGALGKLFRYFTVQHPAHNYCSHENSGPRDRIK